MFKWFFDVLKFTEEETEKRAGIEILLYLNYLKYSGILFLSIFCFGGIPLLILYHSDSFDKDNDSVFRSHIERFTIKSYKGVQDKCKNFWLIFIVYALSVTLA
jgi:hypothetical protein